MARTLALLYTVAGLIPTFQQLCKEILPETNCFNVLDESLLITLSGAIAGVGLGLLIAWSWVQSLGDFMPGISSHLPAGAIIGIAVAAVILGSVAAALPARRAARLNVIDALSYE